MNIIKSAKSISVMAALVIGGLLVGAASDRSAQAGLPVSDAAAAKIMGGCTGTSNVPCTGSPCTGSWLYCTGGGLEGVLDTNSGTYCGGTPYCDCSSCYSSVNTLCGTGG